jgi:hypothetical protein
MTSKHDETDYQLKQLLASGHNDPYCNPPKSGKQLAVAHSENILSSPGGQGSSSVAGKSSIDIDNLFRMKEEYIFVFGN